MRKIAVFTGTRAEYGLLKGVFLGIMNRKDCSLHSIASGTHLDSRYGATIEDFLIDGIAVHDCADVLASSNPVGVCNTIGLGTIKYAAILEKSKPDLLVVLGDRYESFAIAAVATVMRIPIAHIHGGEATEGLIDEAFRHSITKMSYLHFTSCETYRRRVIQLGEAPKRVFTVGSLGVENALNMSLLTPKDVHDELGLDYGVPYMVCTLHPVTLTAVPAKDQVSCVLQALENFPNYAIIFTGANADPGGGEINDILRKHVANHTNARFFMSLGQQRYFSTVKFAACVLGNSSSGIIEAPCFHVPVLDIGDRQKGRERASSVLHCEQSSDAIINALSFALSNEYQEQNGIVSSPYDIPNTAKNIVDVIASYPLENVLCKPFYNIELP